MVYLTSGFVELGEVAGLYPRKERIFFERGLAALIKDCHLFAGILASPLQSSKCALVC
jgi:hypothetical protein